MTSTYDVAVRLRQLLRRLMEYVSNFKNVDQMIKTLFQQIESFEKNQWTSALYAFRETRLP
jgi:hypothetical protein